MLGNTTENESERVQTNRKRRSTRVGLWFAGEHKGNGFRTAENKSPVGLLEDRGGSRPRSEIMTEIRL